jgi:2-iminobutanoate/2-iminopropanoate deaminase
MKFFLTKQISFFSTKKAIGMKRKTHAILKLGSLFLIIIFIISSGCQEQQERTNAKNVKVETPEYFYLRPEVEKEYGYTHAVKIGDDIKISGAVSMDYNGNLIGAGNMDMQMKNCYKDLEIILNHYGCTFDDVVVENVYTTDMTEFIRVSNYRKTIYKKQFPTGTWLEVNGLALPGQMIEVDMEAHISH